jgi:hypothetical protein
MARTPKAAAVVRRVLVRKMLLYRACPDAYS